MTNDILDDDVVAHPRLNDDQLALVRLLQLSIHKSDYVAEWRHLFQGAMIRATTSRGRTATLQRDLLQGLVDQGLLMPSPGGTFYLTDLGRGL